MNLHGKPELQERLAAEYALGTLRGPARARLRHWLERDAALARAVAQWEARLGPMAQALAPVRPPGRVWRGIERRIGVAAGAGLWASLAFWRGLAIAATGAAAALVAAVALVPPRVQAPAQPPVALRADEVPASYLAILTEPATQRPVLVVSAGRKHEQLRVRTLDPAIHVEERSLELWALPRGGAPKSLGVLARAERLTLKLAASADQSLADVVTLAVSLEPRGGSPTGAPTGPVLYAGPCVKYW
jgi:anti-sigma-K factor RskA